MRDRCQVESRITLDEYLYYRLDKARIIAGKKNLIKKMYENSLYRAFRYDKIRLSIMETINAVNRGMDNNLETSLLIERDLFSNLFQSSDPKEGLSAFIEKRKPNFQNK